MTENCRMNTARFLALTFLPSLPFFAAAAAFSFVGAMRVTMHLLAPQRRDGGVGVVGDALAVDRLAAARPTRICKCRHD